MILEETLDVTVRGTTIRFAVFNNRLRVWAERFEDVEPELLDLIDSLPAGSRFFDAGASIGNFALYAAISAHLRVTAFEPEAQNYATMELNHYLNRDRLTYPFFTFNVALAESRGVGTIFTRDYGAGEHVKILGEPATRDTHESFNPGHEQSVLKLPLDELAFDYGLGVPNVLKIDVDGSELILLRGAQQVLAHPDLTKIFIELSETEMAEPKAAIEKEGFSLTKKTPVVRLRGGHYDGLFNCTFER